MNKIIQITPEEAMLIDWVLTMHEYDSALFEELSRPSTVTLRKKAASVITHGEPREIIFTLEEMNYLLITIPITFRFYKEDIGYSLKCKLLATLTTPKLDLNLEVKDGITNGNNSGPRENYSESGTQDSP